MDAASARAGLAHMQPLGGELVRRALATVSVAGIGGLWDDLEHAGAVHQRPVGDRWGNRGLFTAAGGIVDHKLVELVTNMHDAVIALAVQAVPGRPGVSGLDFATAYDTPRDAVEALLADQPRAELAGKARVELHLAGEAGDQRRLRSVVFRDRGTGMSPAELPGALFRVGSSRKDGVLWQQGAFGRGGLTVLPSCLAWVVVTRKQPSLLGPGEPDLVTVAIVRWVKVGNRQTDTAVYQVTEPWQSDGDIALPWSVPAGQCDFAPGTHITVVGFQAEGIWVSRLGDERSVDTLLDTRLFEPALPTSLVTPALGERDERLTLLRGLGRRLEANPRADRVEGQEDLPFMHEGVTYRLPIRFYLFPGGDVGARRRFVARDHALIWISNGQVHAHWSPAEFRHRTRLPKLADRILVVVDTDALPLALRTGLFTADRTDLLRNADAVRLEEELIAFLDDWEELWEANTDLIRDAIRRSNSDRSTLGVARRISRALRVRNPGSSATAGGTERAHRERPTPAPRVLLEDPTELTGPEAVIAVRGRSKGIYFAINAEDDFVPRRADIRVSCGHLDVDPETGITIGRLRGGRLRVAVAVPPDAELVETELKVEVPAWIGRSGGRKGPLERACPFRVVEVPSDRNAERRAGTGVGTDDVDRVAVVWTTHEAEEGWTARTVGVVERIDADSLAQAAQDYAGLAGRHHEVLLVRLNEEFAPLKSYSAIRAKDVGDEGVARAKDRYAVGVGVDMLMLDRYAIDLADSGHPVDDRWLAAARESAARGVLAVMPDYDQLAAEAGLDGL